MRVIGIIQCRMASSRLPGKVVKTLRDNTVLEWVIKRVECTKKLDAIVLATTIHKEDDIVEQIGDKCGLPVIRGDKKNVLKRYILVMNSYPSKAVVRITADNPLTDPQTMDKLISFFFDEQLDYSYTKDIPYGAGVDIYDSSKLHTVADMANEERHREHINTYFLDHPELFKLEAMQLPKDLQRPDIRITLDTADDFERLKSMFDLMVDPLRSGLREIIDTYDSLSINMKISNRM